MINIRLADYLRKMIGATLTKDIATNILLLSLPAPNVIDLDAFGCQQVRDIIIRAERVVDVQNEVEPVFCDAWRAIYPDIPYCPELDLLVSRERVGAYFLTTARRAGEIVGIVGVYLNRSELGGHIVGQEHMVYLKPEYRHSKTASVMCRFAERCAAALGAQRMRLSVRTDPRIVEILKAEGYRQTAVEMTKELEAQ